MGFRDILGVKFGTQRVNIEEGIFSVVCLRDRHPVQTGEALITHGWQVHVRSFFSDLDSLEFSIVEVISVGNVFLLGWVNSISDFSEVRFVELGFLFCLVDISRWEVVALYEVLVNGCCACLCKTLAKQVLRCDLWNETLVTWNMLRLERISWSTDPCLTLHRGISKFKLLTV